MDEPCIQHLAAGAWALMCCAAQRTVSVHADSLLDTQQNIIENTSLLSRLSLAFGQWTCSHLLEICLGALRRFLVLAASMLPLLLPAHTRRPARGKLSIMPIVAALTNSQSGLGAADVEQGADNYCALLAFVPVSPVIVSAVGTLKSDCWRGLGLVRVAGLVLAGGRQEVLRGSL